MNSLPARARLAPYSSRFSRSCFTHRSSFHSVHYVLFAHVIPLPSIRYLSFQSLHSPFITPSVTFNSLITFLLFGSLLSFNWWHFRFIHLQFIRSANQCTFTPYNFHSTPSFTTFIYSFHFSCNSIHVDIITVQGKITV